MKPVIIIGAGNAATCLGLAFRSAGVPIAGIHSRDERTAAVLAERLGSVVLPSLTDLPSDAGLYLLAVSDAAIGELSRQLKVEGIVAHCSGVTPLEALKINSRHGVLYPLQTLSSVHPPEMREVPVCVEGSSKEVADELMKYAACLTSRPLLLGSEKRQQLHLAAVFSNNFSNHLFRIAAQILSEESLPFDLLQPLIRETVRKLEAASPAEAQTGPAMRNDRGTIDRQLELLAKHPEFRKIYELMTESIREAESH